MILNYIGCGWHEHCVNNPGTMDQRLISANLLVLAAAHIFLSHNQLSCQKKQAKEAALT